MTYHLFAIELDDVVPRRHRGFPNLYVGKSLDTPQVRFAILQSRDTSSWFSRHLIRPRPELIPSCHYDNIESAHCALKSSTEALMDQGFTVNRDQTIWTVYVIELDSNAVEEPGSGYVYVGETSKPHEMRFHEHLTRARNARTKLFSNVVAHHGRKLRPDLAPNTVLYSKASSKQAEADWADHLRALGYVVEGGH